MQQFYLRYPGFLRKALILSFDDGPKEDCRFVEILNHYGLKGTFNLNGGYLDKTLPEEDPPSTRISIQQARLLQEYGHEIALHGYSHPFLSTLPAGQAAAQLLSDRKTLERLFGGLITGLALPFEAEGSPEVLQAAKACGITYIRSLTPTYGFSLPVNLYRWQVTCHFLDPRFSKLCTDFLIKKPRWTSELFFVWGHSYELRENQSWDSWERYCAQLGRNEEIWYAGCGELGEYLTAARKLRSSADGKILYNPTASTLYLETDPDGVQIVLGPGQQVVLGWSIP